MGEQKQTTQEEEREPPGERYLAERRFFSVLLVFLVATLFLGALQLWNAIRSPFTLPTARSNTNALGPTASIIASLTAKDTDSDGLNDYDELYRYQTSPYLADSDSDGAQDRDEVTDGKNPNCPEGQTCTPIALESAANAQTPTTNSATASVAGENVSLADLREALRSAGAPATTLDAMSDDELRALYREVTGTEFSEGAANNQPSTINSGQQSTNDGQRITNGTTSNASATNAPSALNAANSTSSSTNTSASTTSLDELQNLTPEQIRSFLEQGGADPGSLDDVDDETLRAVFLEAIQNVASSGS